MIARFAIPFFIMMGFVVGPLLVFLLCQWLAPRRYRRKAGVTAVAVVIMLTAYGMLIGFGKLETHRIEYASRSLPKAFDGYRIVHFSDAHVGTFEGCRSWMLQRLVDSINAQHADMIVFTGDLENLSPADLEGKTSVLSRLKAPDGVYSVLGNHDYEIYINTDEATRRRDNLKTQELERQMGWRLLMNEHEVIRRDSDSIVIAGMENWGVVRRMPRRGNVRQTMAGVNKESFVVMLQHDPSCWREKILPESHAQLTLSGHTHGGQFSILGWSPVALASKEWHGLYREGSRALFVSSGVGGLIPFRLNMPGEIVVVTLRASR